MLAAVLAAVLLAPPPAPASASSYCSPSGDYCKSVRKVGGRWTIGIPTAALYGSGTRYTLCVRDPSGVEACRGFRLRDGRYGSYTSTVRWSAHFPTGGGKGTYRVRWDHERTTYGPSLTFKR